VFWFVNVIAVGPRAGYLGRSVIRGFVIMKRDLNLIRQIALLVEAADYSLDADLDSNKLVVDGYDTPQIAYHCKLMVDAGLFEAIDTKHLGSSHHEYRIGCLTWKGHDFLDAARNNTTWNKLTKTIKDKAVSVTFDSLVFLLRRAGENLVVQGADYLAKM